MNKEEMKKETRTGIFYTILVIMVILLGFLYIKGMKRERNLDNDEMNDDWKQIEQHDSIVKRKDKSYLEYKDDYIKHSFEIKE